MKFPWQRILLSAQALLLGAASLAAAPTARRGDDGTLILENGTVRAVIDPARGAALTSLVVKNAREVQMPEGVRRRDREVLSGPSFVDSNVMVWCRIESLAERAFEVGKEAAAVGGEAVWELSCMLPEDHDPDGSHLVGRAEEAIVWYPKEYLRRHPYETVRLTKRYRLGDANLLRVEYDLTNTGKEAIAVCLATQVALAGETLFAPSRDGVYEIELPRRGRQVEAWARWLYDPPLVWLAAVDGAGAGAAAIFDARHASALEVDNRRVPQTFLRTRTTLAPGETFADQASLLPLAKMPRVQGAGAELAAGFRITPEKASGSPSTKPRTYLSQMLSETQAPQAPAAADQDPAVAELLADINKHAQRSGPKYRGEPVRVDFDLFSPRDRQVEVLVTARPASAAGKPGPKGTAPSLQPPATNIGTVPEPLPLATRKLALAAGKAASVEVTFAPPANGTYAVAAEVREDGKPVATFEQPIIAGRPSGLYRLAAPQRVGQVNRDFFLNAVGRNPVPPDWQPSREIVTPHVKYANPLAGGPLRVLCVVPYSSARDVVEMAQRIQVDYDYVMMDAWDYSMDLGVRASWRQVDVIRDFLSRSHDVYLFGQVSAQRFPIEVMEEIARRVEQEGAGMILAGVPHRAGTLAEWDKKAQTDGKLFDNSRIRVARPGKGRVVFIDGAGTGKDDTLHAWYATGGSTGQEDDWELFTRIVQWAAGRHHPGVAIRLTAPASLSREKLAEAALTARLRNTAAQDFEGAVRLTARKDLEKEYGYHRNQYLERRQYPSWEDWGQAEMPLRLAAGEERELRVPLPSLPYGPFALDVQVLDKHRAAVAWERRRLSVESRPQITALVLAAPGDRRTEIAFGANLAEESRLAADNDEKRVFTANQDDIIKLDCRFTAADAVKKVKVVAWDPWGRALFESEAAPQRDGDRGSIALEIPTRNAQHRVMELKVQLLDEAGVIQERRLLGIIMARRQRWHDYAWVCYSPDSDIRPDATGYDSRHRSAVVFRDIFIHAWCNMNMTGLTGGFGWAEDILLPGDDETLKLQGPPATPPEAGSAGEAMVKELFKKEIDHRKGYIRVPCFLDPKWRKATLDHMEGYFRTRSHLARPFNVTMGDEDFYTKERVRGGGDKPDDFRRQFILSRDGNICRCTNCLAAFRDYCRKQYGGDLAALNHQWGADCKTWDEVAPPLLSTNRIKVPKPHRFVDLSTNDARFEERCPPEEQWAHVIDHRRFIDHQVGDLLAEMRRAAARGEPTAHLGWGDLMGDTSMWNGLDAYLCAPHMDWNGLDHEGNIWSSLGHPYNNHFVGYSKQYSVIREAMTPWWMLFEGTTGIANWNSAEYPKHRADFTFHPASLETFAAMREIRDNGVDRILVGRRYNDPVAMHYDPTSIYISEMEDWQEDQARFFQQMAIASRGSNDACKRVEQSWAGLIHDACLQYFTTAYGHLEEGHFGKFGMPKLLFLPYTQCLSDAQARTLEKFVREGGCLVGDIHTGFRDGHGRRREQGALNEVFGIRQLNNEGRRVKAGPDGKPVPVIFGKQLNLGERGFTLAFESVGPADIQATTATAWAGFDLDGRRQPAFLVNRYGKGTAIYLNFLPSGFREVIGDVTEGEREGEKEAVDSLGQKTSTVEAQGRAREAFHAIFSRIVALAGLESPVRCEGRPGIYRFGQGEITYLGVCAGYKSPPAWRRDYDITLPRPKHVYDSRDGKYLVYADRVKAVFDEDRLKLALLYALLPYKVEGIEVQLNAAEVPRGGTVSFSARLLPAAAQKQLHAVALRVTNPKGEELPWYRNSFATKEGVAQGRIDLATSDLPGRWTARLRDAATGVTTEFQFTVK